MSVFGSPAAVSFVSPNETKRSIGRPHNPLIAAIMVQHGCSRATAYRLLQGNRRGERPKEALGRHWATIRDIWNKWLRVAAARPLSHGPVGDRGAPVKSPIPRHGVGMRRRRRRHGARPRGRRLPGVRQRHRRKGVGLPRADSPTRALQLATDLLQAIQPKLRAGAT